MGNYQGYQQYKDSGVEWLGDIPEHWEVKRIKFLVNKIGSGKTPKGGSEVYIDSGIMLIRSQNVYDDGFRLDDVVYIDDEIDNIQANSRVFPNDILLNITGASIGRVCLVPTDFGKANVNQHVCIFRPKLKEIFPQYLHLLFCSTQGKEQIFSYENGTSREGLNFQEAGNLTFAIPPLHEQQKIAQFLDYKTKQIDELIKKKETLIEKLDEKRTALISHAVTKGLDSSVPMKDSGIEWLGDIPKHWEAKRLNFLTKRIGDGIHSTPKYVDYSEYYFINGNNLVNGNIFINESTKCVSKDEFEKYNLNLDGDTLLLSINGTIGNVAFYQNELVMLGKSAAYITLKSDIFKNFAYYCLLSKNTKNYFFYEVTGTTIFNLSLKSIKNTFFPTPPLHEQQKIAQFLDYKTTQIDLQKAKIKQAIELLKEYRTSLITNAVTGKIDVRQIAIP